MRIGRVLPPAAAPLCARDFCHGVIGALAGARARAARESEMRHDLGACQVHLVSSGAAALTLILRALKSQSSRRNVVIPAYTCFSVPAAVLKAGLVPVLCDVDVSTFDFDPAQLRRVVNTATLCVVAHHLFGIPSDIRRVRTICAESGAFVVEDAAQAMGGTANGRKLGTLGDAALFSLGRGKCITCGSGGAIIVNAPALAPAIAAEIDQLAPPRAAADLQDWVRVLLLAIFIRPWLYWLPAAVPQLRLGETVFPHDIPLRRLSGFKAGLLWNWKLQLRRSHLVRRRSARYFHRRLGVHAARRPPAAYLRLPLLAASAQQKRQLCDRARGLGVSAAYPAALNHVPEVQAVIGSRRFPAAEDVAARLLTLPTHQWLSARDRQSIAALWSEVRPA